MRGVKSKNAVFDSRVSRSSIWSQRGRSALFMLWLVTTALATSSCGTKHAILNFAAPQSATAGSPFTVTVSVTINNQPDTAINSRLHFTSTDTTAILPGDYYFTPADGGSHTWPSGFILMTPGNQTISGEIVDAIGINGSVSISVTR